MVTGLAGGLIMADERVVGNTIAGRDGGGLLLGISP